MSDITQQVAENNIAAGRGNLLPVSASNSHFSIDSSLDSILSQSDEHLEMCLQFPRGDIYTHLRTLAREIKALKELLNA